MRLLHLLCAALKHRLDDGERVRGPRLEAAVNCLACGDHPLNYIHCDRWDCPLLVARAKIEGLRSLSYRQAVTAILGPQERAATEVMRECQRFADRHDPLWDLEEERDPEPPDEDDDEIAVDWDENGFWPSENDETEEDEGE